MMTSPVAVLAMAAGVLSALAILAGGIVLFAVGKGRGALSGTGFIVLGVGTVISTVLSPLLPRLAAEFNLGSAAVSGLYGGIYLIFSLAGWGLVVAALVRFRTERTEAPTPPPYAPGPGWGGPPNTGA